MSQDDTSFSLASWRDVIIGAAIEILFSFALVTQDYHSLIDFAKAHPFATVLVAILLVDFGATVALAVSTVSNGSSLHSLVAEVRSQKDLLEQVKHRHQEEERVVSNLSAQKVTLSSEVYALNNAQVNLQNTVTSLNAKKDDLQSQVDALQSEKLRIESEIQEGRDSRMAGVVGGVIHGLFKKPQ